MKLPAVSGISAHFIVILPLVTLGRRQFLVADTAVAMSGRVDRAGQGIGFQKGFQGWTERTILILLERGHQLVEH